MRACLSTLHVNELMSNVYYELSIILYCYKIIYHKCCVQAWCTFLRLEYWPVASVFLFIYHIEFNIDNCAWFVGIVTHALRTLVKNTYARVEAGQFRAPLMCPGSLVDLKWWQDVRGFMNSFFDTWVGYRNDDSVWTFGEYSMAQIKAAFSNYQIGLKLNKTPALSTIIPAE